jgi:tetratricopeptide (TPR) repeat protein
MVSRPPLFKSGGYRHVWIAGVALLLMAFGLGTLRMVRYPFIVRPEIKIVADSRLAKIVSLDHDGFLADLLFIDVDLHSGSLMWKPRYINFDAKWSYKMMDVVTDLDPKFYMAYLFSIMGLVHNLQDVRLAEPIVQKGMKQFPDSWELPFWAGYGYFNYLGEYKKAAKYMWQAYEKPHAPKYFLALMFAALKKSGDYRKAIVALKMIMDSTKDPNLKTIYAKKVVRLSNFDQIMTAANRFHAVEGRYPQTLSELVQGQFIKAIPVDPDGAVYVWNTKKQLPTVAER